MSGGYFNYMQADEPIERVRSAFRPEAFERLQAVKRRYDPENVLRRNQNIRPPRPTPRTILRRERLPMRGLGKQALRKPCAVGVNL